MPLKCRCRCGCKLLVSEQSAGSSIKCPQCERRLKVPVDAAKRMANIEAKRSKKETPQKQADESSSRRKLPTLSSLVDLPAPEPPPRQGDDELTSGTPQPTADSKRKSKSKRKDAEQRSRKKPPPLPSKKATQDSDSEQPSESPEQPTDSPAPPTESKPRPREKAKGPTDDKPVASPDKAEPAPKASPKPKPKKSPTGSERAKPTKPKAAERPGYIADQGRVSTARLLAYALAGTALLGLIPAVQDVIEHFQTIGSDGVSRWAYALLLIAVTQLAYSVYVAQLPDWSTVWVLSIVTLVIATGYAMMFGVTFIASADSPVIQYLQLSDRMQGNVVPSWCLIMLSLTSIVCYAGGRVSSRWRTAIAA